MKDQDQKLIDLVLLNHAISTKNSEKIEELLNREEFSLHNFDIDYKYNPLISIIQSNNPKLLDKNIFQKILEKGVSISVKDPETGNNILYELIAVRTRMDSNDAGKIQEINELIEIILKQEPKLLEEVSKDRGAVSFAIEQGFTDIADLLLKHGANPNSKLNNQEGSDLLSVAIEKEVREQVIRDNIGKLIKDSDVENVTDQAREQPQRYKNLGLLNFYISEGNIEEITKLLDDKNFSLPGFDVDYIDNPLIRVLESRNSKQIKKVLYDKMLAKNISIRDSETGMNILHELIIARMQINSDDTSKIQEINDLIEIVLEANPKLNEDITFSNMNPISLAVENGFNDIAELLLRYKANPNSKLYGRDDSDLLSVAIKDKNIELIQILLKHEKANPNSLQMTPTNALELINIARNNPELFQLDKIIELLLELKALSEAPLYKKEDTSLLTAALDKQDTYLIQTLLKYKKKHPKAFDINLVQALRLVSIFTDLTYTVSTSLESWKKNDLPGSSEFEEVNPYSGKEEIQKAYFNKILFQRIENYMKTKPYFRRTELSEVLDKIRGRNYRHYYSLSIDKTTFRKIMEIGIRDNQLEIVKAAMYLKKFVKEWHHDNFFWSAVKSNRDDIAKFLITINNYDEQGLNLLLATGKTELIKFLLKNQPSRRNDILSKAIDAKANLDTIKMLIEEGADINSHLPLACAIRRGDLDIIRLLIEKGADVNNKIITRQWNDDGLYCIKVKKRVSDGYGESYEYEKITTPFISAVESGNVAILKLLIENGAKLLPESQHICKLHAARAGNLGMVKLLIENTDKLVSKDIFMASINNCHFKIINYFLTTPSLQLDIDINENREGEARVDNVLARLVKVALKKKRNASYYSELSETLKILLEIGADMNGKNDLGESALTYIVASGRKDLIKLFLDHSQDLQVDDQKTLLENLKKLELKKLDPEYKEVQEKIKYLKKAIDQKQAIEKKYNNKAEKRFRSALEELTIGKGKEEEGKLDKVDKVVTDNKLGKYMKVTSENKELLAEKAKKVKEKLDKVKLGNIDKFKAIFKGEDKVRLNKTMRELGALESFKDDIFEKEENKILQTEKLKQKYEKQNKGPKDKKGK